MLFYQILITLATPALLSHALWQRLRGREDRAAFRARIGLTRSPERTGPTLWIHGASNGELASARAFITLLQARYPKYRLLITCNTVSARDMAAGWDLTETTVQLAPFDLRWLARSLIRARDVRALIVLENEFWPNRFLAAAEAALPVIVLGARISGRSARRWSQLDFVARTVLESVRLLSAQDGDSQDRFVALGLSNARVAPRVNLKALYTPPPLAGAGPLDGIWHRSTTWLAASTHEGEDESIIAAHCLALKSQPGLRLILAPRHPRRAERITSQLIRAGLSFARRSKGEPVTAETQVLLADTMGEMPLWYTAAAICFVGGSLVDQGGHTPFEPGAFETVLLHGPHVANFDRIYSRLDREDGALAVSDAESLANALTEAMRPARALSLVRNARRALASDQDIEGLFARLDPMLR
ncbi:3-deoxy-D-manno-octulosonic-acid transferase [Poseidonocella pacifica]|uniref:3-deoxy-D-manno-octulosonic acid transferase n=1 Tax=Poseidonocella pacifica TaxID=871651 RepID=A0A1I0WHP9_9RHOB|nr:glycosyltransferase N-terminal domain-containing protein [Poseidonocella pacifica]SFA87768.1 3-deoxy-D-manno-octulosonic-acid transferase [Poseidonocella pacifica]